VLCYTVYVLELGEILKNANLEARTSPRGLAHKNNLTFIFSNNSSSNRSQQERAIINGHEILELSFFRHRLGPFIIGSVYNMPRRHVLRAITAVATGVGAGLGYSTMPKFMTKEKVFSIRDTFKVKDENEKEVQAGQPSKWAHRRSCQR